MKFLFLVLLALVACTNKKDSGKQELYIAIGAEIPTIDPATCYDTVCGPVVASSYETLY